jgi:hypothetical protein
MGDAGRREVIDTDGERNGALHADGAPVEIGSIEKMSKSKKNVVDPDEIVATYGADTARWFMLSDSPPERDVQWTEAGDRGRVQPLPAAHLGRRHGRTQYRSRRGSGPAPGSGLPDHHGGADDAASGGRMLGDAGRQGFCG